MVFEDSNFLHHLVITPQSALSSPMVLPKKCKNALNLFVHLRVAKIHIASTSFLDNFILIKLIFVDTFCEKHFLFLTLQQGMSCMFLNKSYK